MPNPVEQLERLRRAIEPVCAAHGVELVDARFINQSGLTLQVLIERTPHPDQIQPDQTSGVSLADCQSVSRDLLTVLDVEEDFGPRNYRLEVGSPGIERPLITRRDFERFAGREVRVRTSRPISGRRRMEGMLRGIDHGVDGDVIRLSVSGEELSVPLAEIAKANLVYRF
jgi:ribosome maturation factor RimP